MAEPAQVVAEQQADHGSCPCCEGTTRTIWGVIRAGGQPRAVYYARFTFGHPERGATALISLGGWTDEEDEAARRSFAFTIEGEGRRPTLTPTDAGAVAWSEQQVLGRKLSAAEAAADPAREEAEDLARLLVNDDERLRLFLTRGGRDTREAAQWLERADARLQGGKDAEAAASATLALGFDPGLTEAWFVRGWARGRDGDVPQGIADLERYLELAPRAKRAERARKILSLWRKRQGEATAPGGQEAGTDDGAGEPS